MSDVNDYDFYRSTKDASLRMAVPRTAGLPPQVDPNDWIIMYATTTEEAMLVEVEADINKRGFSYYCLV